MKEISADYADERRLGFMEKLLDGVDVEWKTLGEIGQKSIQTANTRKARIWEEWNCFLDEFGRNLTIFQANKKFITEAGFKNSNTPKSFYVQLLNGVLVKLEKPYSSHTRLKADYKSVACGITFDESKVNPDYIYHYLDTQ